MAEYLADGQALINKENGAMICFFACSDEFFNEHYDEFFAKYADEKNEWKKVFLCAAVFENEEQ